jgi:phosphopantothenoylcysteine decarboxylase/phosphopantothenate--cysteine ligase
MSRGNILLVVSGSVACHKACEVLSALASGGCSVRVVATASALRFVGTAALEGLSGKPVATDLFEPGAALDHIALDRWADAVLVCPATASLINRMAAGIADDLAGCLFLAHDRAKPWLVAPAMNPAMWSHPATREAVSRLEGWGVRFLSPGSGRTACGEVGEGRMAEPGDIVREVRRALSRPARPLRVLVTSGGTSEPIDAVRVVTNLSTGATGARIAGHFHECGHDVLLLRAEGAPAAPPVREATFRTYSDLDARLRDHLGSEPFDAVIHAAAVSDFGVEEVLTGSAAADRHGKIPSGGALTVRLRPYGKLLDGLKGISLNKEVVVAAFKLTSGAGAAEAQAAAVGLLSHGADIVVQNDLSQNSPGGPFPAVIHSAGLPPVACATRAELAERLEESVSRAAAARGPKTLTHAPLP